ncbi:NucA/NucB deoxyribonuclease domain-containing protein [Sinosporangium siamense]|uniref:Deoxyribonuclease NucA/NucB domain-containing protein n=1 Tax=Sinosporangium siamense TaxID=1367973 RepID=A0A919RBJ6_9ACTN|nr:NucA/NucB deoxyribonuclease domain-containing protein [Sinosporangium siamense]GII90462.1 hypothetical protein Ssi02_06930 [Sinosporangium siamense]
MNTPISTAAGQSAAARSSTADAGAGRGQVVEKLVVEDGKTVAGVSVATTRTPRLTAWVSAARDGRARAEVQIAHKPAKTAKVLGSDRVIWAGQAAVKPGDSRVTLQVPKKRLKAGSELKWRARVSGATGDGRWTEWRDLIVGASKTGGGGIATSAASDPAPIRRVLPSKGATVTPSATYQQCHSATSTGNAPYAITPSRFAHCRYSGWKIPVWGIRSFLPVKIGDIEGHQLTYIQGTIDRREFKVYKHIYIDRVSGTIPTGLRFASTIASNSPGCSAVSATGMTGEYTVAQWQARAGDAWHIEEQYTSGPGTGYHNKSDCTVNYSMVVKHPEDSTRSSTPIYADGTFRCDRSPQVKWHNKRGGGCVHNAGVPSFTMTRNDVNEKGTKFPDMYDHIKRALTAGSVTYPKPGGKSYPDLLQAKNIPGGVWHNPLTRHGYEPTNEGNRTTAGVVCKNEIKKEEGTDCDEFPFASTLQGATRANPPHNFSVDRIESVQNQDHGRVLKAWYSNNRILNGDKYWIDIQ